MAILPESRDGLIFCMLMLRSFAGLIRLSMQLFAQSQPPSILQIHRERLKSGTEDTYQAIEEDTARICAEIGCPHPYLEIEALTGPKQVWFFNGYDSSAEPKQVVEDYAKNAVLMSALRKNSKKKASLTAKPVSVFAKYRQDLSTGVPWILGQGRFLVITVTKGNRRSNGTVFEGANGTRFIVVPAQNREEADAAAAIVGTESNVFAVRPSWSFPSKEWIAADPAFWQPSPAAKAK